MTRSLRIAKGLSLPFAAVTETFAILAKRGAGKSYTAGVLAEEMLKAGQPIVVVDPTGAWWGLRSSADGKHEGLPITVLGGDHGDAPLEDGAGALVADLVAEEHVSLVLDLSNMSKGAMKRFMTDFAERLYEKNRDPLHVFLDEADLFVPQRIMKGAERMFGAVDEIVRRGRIRGIGVTLISQRSAVVNKDVLTQAEVLIALRTTHANDLAPIRAWMEAHELAFAEKGGPQDPDEIMSTLPGLPVGEAWILSSGFLDRLGRFKIREKETFDSSKTPKPGEKRVVPKVLARVDLERLRVRMKASIERAAANDPAALKKKIAALEADLRKAQAVKPAPAQKAVEVEIEVVKEAQVKRLEALIARAEKVGVALGRHAGDLRDQLARVQGKTVPPSKPAPAPVAPREQRARTEKPVAKSSGDGDASLRSGERRMLEVLARNHLMKMTRAQLGTLSGFTPSGGTYTTYFGNLRRLGLVVERDKNVTITEAGMEAVGVDVPPTPQTTDEIVAMWKKALRAGEVRMLDEVLRNEDGITRDALGEATGFTASGGTFTTYLGMLRRNGLVAVDGNMVRPGEALLLSGALA